MAERLGKKQLIRKSFVMQLKPGCREEYTQRHSPIWPELQEVLKAHGVHNYSIFLEPSTHRLFAYAEIEDEAQWAAIAGTSACRKWWLHMGDIMATNPDGSPTAVELPEVFHLD